MKKKEEKKVVRSFWDLLNMHLKNMRKGFNQNLSSYKKNLVNG